MKLFRQFKSSSAIFCLRPRKIEKRLCIYDITLFHSSFLFNSEKWFSPFQDEIILIIFDIGWFTLVYRICYLLCIYFKSIVLLRMLRANIESL